MVKHDPDSEYEIDEFGARVPKYEEKADKEESVSKIPKFELKKEENKNMNHLM